MTGTAQEPLSRDRILRAAVRMADQDGLDAVSLRKLGAELGVHVTSLYHHVPTKDALIDGMVEELLTSAELPSGDLGWEPWVRAFTAGVAGLAREHPGAFAVLQRRPVQGERAALTFEAGLGAFRRAGLDAPRAYAAVKTVTLAVLGVCVEQAFGASGHQPMTDVSRLPSQEFPVLREVADRDEDFDAVATVADLLVAGLQSTLEPRRGRSRDRAGPG